MARGPIRLKLHHVLMAAVLFALPACNDRDDSGESKPQALISSSSPNEAVSKAAPIIPLPKTLENERVESLLYEALAGTELFAAAMRRKEETGYVVEPGKDKDLVKARADLDAIRKQIAKMSEDGVPTYVLVHSLHESGSLLVWLLAPDGGIAAGISTTPFEALETLTTGLGVTRIAAARGMELEEAPQQGEDSLRAAIARDQTPAAKAERKATLKVAREILLPGDVSAALGSRHGRLLILPAHESGTAPYAAMTLDNGIAAENWSFVVLSDIANLTQADKPFAIGNLDINRAIIVGDPDLSWDRRKNGKPKWYALPGAREEAETVANMLGKEQAQLFIGPNATKKNVLAAINKNQDAGIVYLATHAIANAKNPLTQGYVALSDEHLYAGHIRQERFQGWDKRHPLVVLSACQTALGRVFGGGGFGVAKTWMSAGAGQVVASLWNVSDPATLALMTRFMRHLKKGNAPEIAMQAAQVETMNLKNKKGEYIYRDDPKMWASFTVYGKPTVDAKPLN